MYYLLSPYNTVLFHVQMLLFLLWSPFFIEFEIRFLSYLYRLLDTLNLILFHK